MLKNYIKALTFQLKPGAPIKRWQLYSVLIIGYIVVPFIAAWYMGLVSAIAIALSCGLAGSILRGWLPYVRGYKQAPEIVAWRLFWLMLCGAFLYSIASHFHDLTLDTNGKIAAVIFIGLNLLVILVALISGNRQLEKLYSQSIKGMSKKELFQ